MLEIYKRTDTPRRYKGPTDKYHPFNAEHLYNRSLKTKDRFSPLAVCLMSWRLAASFAAQYAVLSSDLTLMDMITNGFD